MQEQTARGTQKEVWDQHWPGRRIPISMCTPSLMQEAWSDAKGGHPTDHGCCKYSYSKVLMDLHGGQPQLNAQLPGGVGAQMNGSWISLNTRSCLPCTAHAWLASALKCIWERGEKKQPQKQNHSSLSLFRNAEHNKSAGELLDLVSTICREAAAYKGEGQCVSWPGLKLLCQQLTRLDSMDAAHGVD